MTAQYIPVLFAFGFATLVAVSLIGLSALLGVGRTSPALKRESYESGMPLLDAAHKRISIKFFLVALVFILFDVEVVFLFPWALAIRELAAAGNPVFLPAGLIFIAVLAIGDIYLWKAGAFDWGGRGSRT